MLDFNKLDGNYFYSMFEDVTFDDEMSDMEKLVYAWQQNTRDFIKYTPKEFLDYFISNFKSSRKEYYRVIMYPVGEDLEIERNIQLVSATTSINIANSIFIKTARKPMHVIVFKVKGEKELRVKPFRDMGEREYILYKPKYLEVVEDKIVFPLIGHNKVDISKDKYRIDLYDKGISRLVEFCKRLIPLSDFQYLVGTTDYEKVLAFLNSKRS